MGLFLFLEVYIVPEEELLLLWLAIPRGSDHSMDGRTSIAWDVRAVHMRNGECSGDGHCLLGPCHLRFECARRVQRELGPRQKVYLERLQTDADPGDL